MIQPINGMVNEEYIINGETKAEILEIAKQKQCAIVLSSVGYNSGVITHVTLVAAIIAALLTMAKNTVPPGPIGMERTSRPNPAVK